MRKKFVAVAAGAMLVFGLSACTASKRTIDPARTNSFQIEGTSWWGFCQGNNAFIWIPSKHDSEPDELEAVIYDDYRCVEGTTPKSSSKPDTDPDGIVDDED